ncbi:hypothetical protein I7I48_12298 [Histoplasma ohiense]|nr:hypothetical protein I7I48_12298 [Histoplasma ohiense (nom. inval.)]
MQNKIVTRIPRFAIGSFIQPFPRLRGGKRCGSSSDIGFGYPTATKHFIRCVMNGLQWVSSCILLRTSAHIYQPFASSLFVACASDQLSLQAAM